MAPYSLGELILYFLKLGATGFGGPNGVTFAPDLNEVWAGDGNSTVKVANPDTKQILASIPTGGTARHTSGLSTLSFMRCVHVVDYDRDALAAVAPHIDALGGAEDLAAHVAAVRARIPK